MRWAFLLVTIVLPRLAIATPDTAEHWAKRLATHYGHAKSLNVEPADKVLANALCGGGVFELEPPFAQLVLTFHDENLFQSSNIRIAGIEAGTDVIAAVRKAGKKKCSADKRYQVAMQAGDTLFVYGARCSQMLTPFYYDVADLVAAIEAEGGKVDQLAIVNGCGSAEHTFKSLANIRKDAAKQRKLYKHRFPASRDSFKQSKRVQPPLPAATAP